ncbi:histone acetyltransferase HAC1-like isoform X2 [Andrographis paniculata]|nr:histone acetyltransferase HAC1-like isoform X2 [Andrographis paniculata]
MIPGQLPNQTGSMMSGIPQQTRTSFASLMQSYNVHHNISSMDPEIAKMRSFMQEQIWEFLMQRWRQSQEVPARRMIDIVKRLEAGLFRTAKTKEEYMNLGTLESRVQQLIKRPHTNNPGQQFAHANSSPIGTMIPTPGYQQAETSSSVGTSSAGGSLVATNGSSAVASSTINCGSSLPPRNGSSGILNGGMASGYQQSSHVFSGNNGGNNPLTSAGVQKMAGKMIPTPGISNPTNSEKSSINKNATHMNLESPNCVGACAATESTRIPHPTKQLIRGQSSHSSHTVGTHMDDGNRPALQQKPLGLSSGPSNGKLGMLGKSIPAANGQGTKERHLEGTVSGSISKPLHQQFDQHPRSALRGDGCGGVAANVSGSRNLYVPVTSVGLTMNNQRLTPSAESVPKGNPSMTSNNLPQHQQQQQPLHELQNRQLAQHQVGQIKQMPNKLPIRSNTVGPSQQSSDTSEAKSGFGKHHHDEGHSRVPHSDMQNLNWQNTKEEHSRATNLLSQSSDPKNAYLPPYQTSDQVQQSLHPQHVVAAKSNFTSHTAGLQPDAALRSQTYSKSQDASHGSGSLPFEHNVQDEFHQRLSGHDVAQLNNMPSEESVIGRSDSSRSAPPKTNDIVLRYQRWLLYLKHGRKCSVPEGKCHTPNCTTVQKLWKHMERCSVPQCTYPRCRPSKILINHHLKCQDGNCVVCIPVKTLVQEKALARSHLNSGSSSSASANISSNAPDNTAGIGERSTPMKIPVIAETHEDLQPPLKRMKIEQSSQPLVSEHDSHGVLAFSGKDCHNEQRCDQTPMELEESEVKMEVDASPGQLNSNICGNEIKRDSLDAPCVQSPDTNAATPNNLKGVSAAKVINTEKQTEQCKLESISELPENASKSGKTKIQAVSMVELFTIEQVQEHIMSLRQWIGQSKAKAERNQAMGHSISENSCQLCGVERLAFEPPPIYCTPCGARIKRNAMYYTFGSGETRHCLCNPCYNEARGDMVVIEGEKIAKARLDKKKNDEETEEWWVQCDDCQSWQHQICALFNGRRNEGGQAQYTCPKCYIAEVESGKRLPLPQNAVLGAKDLPTTNLSDHLEQRLFLKLKQDRQDRARLQGKSYDEVPGAESLVVRVVSSVEKKLDVKPRFLEIFQDQSYPSEFPYKSKVILLFQRIEGVEVCLFGMYVQEYGSECQQPNHRRVYLSYLDSVKYFRPDIKTVTGEALRTFVYHEILIGYLEHCKMRGFTSCYIWACPPLKGEDYILYCHPEIQKTPKSDKLREWYLAMLRKATKEDIVVDLTNLYEHFFVTNAECKAKVTAARLPYFDGDYWPGAAEDIISQLQQEDNGKKQPKKGGIKKSVAKRALKASGQTDLSCNKSKDLMLMHKLGETISPMREDFIMVHLQHSCSHCCILMVSGKHWVCRQCKNFQLCDKCYGDEQLRDNREKHPVNQKDSHPLYPAEITGVPDETKENEILESEFFDTRQAFLSLCQGNHYQYDTLRRAKHSSMMILYHLHNPTAPAFITQCATCRMDIESGQGWRCETCPDYDVCNACYQKNGGKDHPHKLTNKKSSDHSAQNQEARQLRVIQLRKMLDLLVHASQCRASFCPYPNCRKVKALFRHGMGCQTRASGGCPLCKKMWYLLQLHARACKESRCLVPRCKDLKLHMKRLQQQCETRRRVAVTEMIRQRTAE